MSTAEETRAAEFRAQECRRGVSLAARSRSLAGDSSAAAAVRLAWAAWTDPAPEVCEPVHYCNPPTNAD
jgi:hypothetical protein